MAKNNKSAGELAVDIQTEINTQGLSGLTEIANAVAEIAGAGNIGAESISLLEYTLSTLQKSKGLSSIKEIHKELKGSLTELKKISTSNASARQKSAKINGLYGTTVENVATLRQTAGATLTKTEKSYIKNIKDSSDKMLHAAEMYEKASESFLKQFERLRDKTSASAQNMLDNASRNSRRAKNMKDSALGTESESQKERRRRNRSAEEFQSQVDAFGRDEYNTLAFNARLGRQYSSVRAGERAKKRLFLGSGIRQNLRAAFYGIEDSLLNRSGFVGAAARFGGNLTKNSKLGDLASAGIAGAGISGGAVAFGALAVAAVKAAKALFKFVKESDAAYAEIDKIKANLSVVYGGRGTSDRVFEQIAQYAIKSPFSVGQTAQQAVMLKQSGVEETDVVKTLKIFGDLAGGNQEKLNHIIENFSKITANEYATARNMQQFTMAGIPIYKALAEELGIKTSEVRTKVQRREVTANDVMNALTKLTEPGGVFYNAVEIGSKTYAARQTNLKDTQQLGKAAFGDLVYEMFGKAFIGVREDFANWYKGIFEGFVSKRDIKAALGLEQNLKEIDNKIEYAKTHGFSDSYIKELQVQKMEVKNATNLAGGENESVLAKSYIENYNKAFANETDYNRLYDLLYQYTQLMYTSSDFSGNVDENKEEAFVNAQILKPELERLGADEKQLKNIGNNIDVAWSGFVYQMQHIFDILNYATSGYSFSDVVGGISDEARGEYTRLKSNSIYSEVVGDQKKAIEAWLEQSSNYKYDIYRGKYREYTAFEKYAFNEMGQKQSKEAGSYLRNLGKDNNSTSSLLSKFDKYYQQTTMAKEEQAKSDEQVIQALKDIYNDRESFGIQPDDKFAFMRGKLTGEVDKDGNHIRDNKGITGAQAVKYLERFFDMNNTQDMYFDNENFEDSMKIFKSNYEGLGADLRRVATELTGSDAAGRSLDTYAKLILNATNATEANEGVEFLRGFSNSFNNKALTTYISGLISNIQLADIDPVKLEAQKKATKINHTYDTNLAPLIRELSEKYLGVSLFRTIGSELANPSGNLNVGNIQPVLSYARNNMDRSMLNTLSNALLSQTGANAVSWKDVSENLVRKSSEYYKSKNQSYWDNGEFIQGNSSGRYVKGFMDIEPSRRNLESYALANGTSATYRAMAQEYSTRIGNLDKFFSETLSSKESKDATSKYLEAKMQEETLIAEYRKKNAAGTLSEDQKEELIKAENRLKDLEATSALSLMGIEKNEEYRNSVTALTHQIIEASDGTKKYAEAYLEALDTMRKEDKQRGIIIESLANFETAIESITKSIDQAKVEFDMLYALSGMTPNASKNTERKYRTISSYILDPTNADILEKALPNMSAPDRFRYIVENVDSADKNYTLKDYYQAFDNNLLVERNKGSLSFEESKGGTFEDIYGTFEEFTNEKIKESIKAGTLKITSLLYDPLKDYDWYNDKELQAHRDKNLGWGYTNDYKDENPEVNKENARKDRLAIYEDERRIWESERDAYNEQFHTDLKEMVADPIAGLLGSLKSQVDSDMSLSRFEQLVEYMNASKQLSDNYATNRSFKISAFAPEFLTYSGNTGHQQKLISDLGLPEQTSYSDYAKSLLLQRDENGDFVKRTLSIEDSPDITGYELNAEKIRDLLSERAAMGLNNKNLSDIATLNDNGTVNYNADIITDKQVSRIVKAKEELDSMKNSSVKVSAQLKNLSVSMRDAFDSAMVDSITKSMEALGESMREGTDSWDAMNKSLKETFTNLVKSLGPQMTQTGLAIAAGAASKAGGPDWGKVMGGLGLAAAGGFLSWAGGFLGADDKDKDEEAQKESRLKQLSDLLSDLIGQARTDAEYYERNMRHERAISADYGISSRSVNDMILTPNGTFSTHPDDYLIATKNPYALSTSGSPNVNITIVNQSGDVVKVASTTKKEKDNGDIDIQAVIVAVTADAIASGEMDGAFAQREARRKGVTRMY